MNVIKTSIALDSATIAELDARGEDRSATMRTIVAWYAEIVNRERPPLSSNEWRLLREVLAGVRRNGIGMLAAALVPMVVEAMRTSDLAARWEVDRAELVSTLEALGFAGRAAVIDDVMKSRAKEKA